MLALDSSLSGSFKKYTHIGDVVLNTRQLIDNKTRKPFDWKFFGVVTKVGHRALQVIRIGAPDGAKDEYSIHPAAGVDNIQLLTEDEWPDGVRAFRAVLIMEGRVEIH